MPNKTILPGLLLALSMLSAFPIRAQEPVQLSLEVPAEDAGLVAEAYDLIELVRSEHDGIKRLARQIQEARGDDLRVLQTLADRQISGLVSNLRSLVKIVALQGDLAAASSRLLDETEAEITAASLLIHHAIDVIEGSVADARKQREDVELVDLPLFEDRLAGNQLRLDARYQDLMHLGELADELGLDSEDDRQFLSRHLRLRAEDLLARVALARQQSAELKRMVGKSPDDGDLELRYEAERKKLASVRSSLRMALDLMRELDLDTATLEGHWMEATGEITTSVFKKSVVTGIAGRSFERISKWWKEHGTTYIFKLVLVLLILAVAKILARVVGRIAARAVRRSAASNSLLLNKIIVTNASRAIMVVGILVALSQFGVELGPLLAGLGIVGFIVGFALQETLANFAAGVMILIYRPFDVGDFVEAAGVTGSVEKMNLVSTTVLTPDNQELVVPNGKIWGDVIRNVTARDTRRVDLVFGISYEDDIPKAENLLREIVQDHDLVLQEPKPNVRVHTLNDSSVDFIVRPWSLTTDYWEVYWDITREVKLRFDREGISIPFPQTDIHVKSGVDSTKN